MKYTTHYEFNKPENSDLFNVEHFNENATKTDNLIYSLNQSVAPMSTHISNQNNPHNVTKAQVGLGSVDNTSDMDKPVSTAVQTALSQKADSSSLGTAATKNVPTSGNASADQVVLGSDTRLSDSRPASDVSAWAKASTKPTYTASEVGAIASSEKGANSGVATLGSDGKVPDAQLPTMISLGETSSTAYRGDRGKTAYDHSQLTSGNPHGVTASDVGLGDVGNFKAVSTVANQGLTDTEKANARTNIGAGDSSFSGDYNDLTNQPTSLSQFTNDCGFVAQYYQTSEPSPSAAGAVWIG